MDSSLPLHLDERLRWLRGPSDCCGAPGEFVLYWMHNALRAHENPALDVAVCFARQNGLPLLVYRGLSEHYPYASDRYHAFIMQGHRDVGRELAERGINSAFHLQRAHNRGPYLRDLTRSAAVLVTEEMPVQPVTGWMERLAIKTNTPIASVDCSCIVPAPSMNRCYTRAFEYRDATKAQYARRTSQIYVEQTIDCEIYDEPLPFEPICLESNCLASLIAKCKIDHSIAPVADTPGGSRAGYRRWDDFKTNRLHRYHRDRNDATIHGGTSRLSAYLHFGMVSPFRIAREASELDAEKFLDELLIWREMSFHFCYHNADEIDTMSALPSWARQTLHEHSEDLRPGDYSWEKFSRGFTGHSLWDAAQRSLLKHGELHNNVRMTWGKTFLQWSRSPERALQMTMDINHRFALDGRDPSSYGGVLWCFGQFDRPFKPEQSVTGTVRTRCPSEHAERMDLDRYKTIVDRPIAGKLPRVAIVGSGIAGLTAARTLSDHGIAVSVFEKSRGVGGRLSTRRVERSTPDETITFDHGAQYFTARDSRFCRFVNSWIHEEVAAPWLGRIVQIDSSGKVADEKNKTPRYVGTPGMNAIAKHLARDLNVELGTEIASLQPTGQQWTLRDTDQNLFDPFDIVLCNCPAPQASRLLDGHSDLVEEINHVRMDPCWAMMIASESLDEVPFDAAFVHDSPISWIAKNSNKPGRSVTPCWIAHANTQWSQQHLEEDHDQILNKLLPVFETLVGKSIKKPIHLAAHRWRYAIAENPLDSECLFDPVSNLGVCGDWCAGSRVEGAFLSGMAVAGTILRRVTIDRPPARLSSDAEQPTLFAD